MVSSVEDEPAACAQPAQQAGVVALAHAAAAPRHNDGPESIGAISDPLANLQLAP